MSIYEIEKYKDIGMDDYYDVYARGLYGYMGEGVVFKREFYETYNASDLPNDCAGFIYCDPNINKKGKGDTTAIVNLWVCMRLKKFYVKSARCFPCTDQNVLIEAILQMRDSRTLKIGFDGWAGQDAQWAHNFRMYARSKGIHIQEPEWCRYVVDGLSKNAQYHYGNGNILFPHNFGKGGDEEGSLFLDQLHSFCNKKQNKADDAPDALICAIQLAFENGYKLY
ncbi:MAG: hypothetical protein FWC41_12555 [Firmicutes bacterium]|nr:hypothetical protein [Bacillota bacterium]